jgi:hypothetical protein
MWTVDEVEACLRRAWDVETCDPADVENWHVENPARGQCGPTALVVNDLLGGDLMLAEVLWPDGRQQGFHYWNVLPDGREVDLTREQFRDGEVVGAGSPVVRPSRLPHRCVKEYLLLRQRTLAALSGRTLETGPHSHCSLAG